MHRNKGHLQILSNASAAHIIYFIHSSLIAGWTQHLAGVGGQMDEGCVCGVGGHFSQQTKMTGLHWVTLVSRQKRQDNWNIGQGAATQHDLGCLIFLAYFWLPSVDLLTIRTDQGAALITIYQKYFIMFFES